jgi:hypothetical protein
VTVPLLAGCTADDGRGSPSPTPSAREPADSPAPSDATGTARSTVPELVVDDAAPFVADPDFGVEVTVTNTGDRGTEVLASGYEYEFTLTTGEGADPEGGVTVSGDGGPEIAPGESLRLTVRKPVDGDPAAVTGYDLTLTCAATGRSVYCED